jgi:uncharacterized protein (TIGR03086 family)
MESSVADEIAIADRHLRVCTRFTEVVYTVGNNWGCPSPCAQWDARAIVEHVIGFHDVLLLRPLDAKPRRPKDDPALRWAATNEALRVLFSRPGIFEGPVQIPAIGNNEATQLDTGALVVMLSQDVLVHTWDLARAVGVKDNLDPELCDFFLRRLPADPEDLAASGMFGPPMEIADNSNVQARLLARLGRDPDWHPPLG